MTCLKTKETKKEKKLKDAIILKTTWSEIIVNKVTINGVSYYRGDRVKLTKEQKIIYKGAFK